MRGEQTSRGVTLKPAEGPSPHARGAGKVGRILAKVTGTIPACAGSRLVDLQVCSCRELGSSTFVDSVIMAIRVERGAAICMLRMRNAPKRRSRRGVFAQNYRMAGVGASPSADRTDGPRVGATRIGAGSTWQRPKRPSPPRDHPRVRGGAVSEGQVRGQGCGTIPAGAGSRVRRRGLRRRPRGHPRACGEQKEPPAAAHVFEGPSPHARGAAGRAAHRRRLEGTIPACAGSRRAGTRPAG